MDRFVVGFAFDETMDRILLVKKLRPEWQKGLRNGIGGKIEVGESSSDAMLRECQEETGLILEWTRRGIMQGTNDDGHKFQCYIFYAYSQDIYMAKQIEDEPLVICHVPRIRPTEVVENLNFLIPFGMYSNKNVFISLAY